MLPDVTQVFDKLGDTGISFISKLGDTCDDVASRKCFLCLSLIVTPETLELWCFADSVYRPNEMEATVGFLFHTVSLLSLIGAR